MVSDYLLCDDLLFVTYTKKNKRKIICLFLYNFAIDN